MDTPGHVDFSAEMERTLQVLDYAVLVINGADGVQGHTKTLWRLLKKYDIPTFLFVNKMDQEGTDKEILLKALQTRLDPSCISFQETEEEFYDAVAMCKEELMEEYLETGAVSIQSLQDHIAERNIFPCYFGSALKLTGVDTLLNGLEQFSISMDYPQEFGARVFKIARDPSGNRLTYLKVTGGRLRAKQIVSNENSALSETDRFQEKIDQIRLYNGTQYTVTECLEAGAICAVTGLTQTRIGQGLGYEEENPLPVLEPVLTYQVNLPEGTDPIVALGKLRRIEEEDPLLHLVWKEKTGEIHAQVMGEVQIEILKRVILDRFGMEVTFSNGSIVYKETIAQTAIGIGHFEPLRHYAEVHLLLEPGERGSGLSFATLCSEDTLDKNWQRLILTHLEEKAHVGVLMGGEITDMRISLIAGRAHNKHTEGGDFRQATYRAIRQGLRGSKSVLLEPVFAFTLEIPSAQLGRAMSDIQKMQGHFDSPVTNGETSILTGEAPVATMRDYQREVNSYTRGFGRLSLMLSGYAPCHNTTEVLENCDYDPEGDLENPTSSVFCAHGAGFVVPWDQVPAYAHVENGFHITEEDSTECTSLAEFAREAVDRGGLKDKRYSRVTSDYITQEEIDEIFRTTYGKKEEDKRHFRRYHKSHKESSYSKPGDNRTYQGKTGGITSKESYLLVDGYNIIFAWPELKELSKVNIDSARDRLMDIMSNYQGYLGSTLILVFDAYKVKGNTGSVMKYHNIHVVYTKEAETADQYIEKTVHEIGHKYQVTVATSDALEQMIIWGDGAIRMSALGLLEAVEEAAKKLREEYDL